MHSKIFLYTTGLICGLAFMTSGCHGSFSPLSIFFLVCQWVLYYSLESVSYVSVSS